MQCPVDGTTLVMTDRNGVEIDYCPSCRGVWLDRGELDKIIERSAAASPPPPQPFPAPPSKHGYDRPGGYDDTDRDHEPRRKKNKLGGFLDDLFDF